MEDRRAHERIDSVEKVVNTHLKEHSKFERALAENVRVSTETAKNTAELVEIFKAAKGFRTFIIWLTPIAVSVVALWAWVKAH